MPVLPFNVSTPGLAHFICWGVVSLTSYFLFMWVGTNRLMGRLAETYINQLLYTEVNRSLRFPLLFSSQIILYLPSSTSRYQLLHTLVTVMTLFYNAFTPTLGNLFQTNQPDHELDDSAGDTVTFTNEKDMAHQRQIWSTFVTALWCSITKITDRTGILALLRYDFQSLLTILA